MVEKERRHDDHEEKETSFWKSVDRSDDRVLLSSDLVYDRVFL